MRTQHGHDLHGGKAGLPRGLGGEGRLAHQAVRALLTRQQAVRPAPAHLHLHRLHPRLLACNAQGDMDLS